MLPQWGAYTSDFFSFAFALVFSQMLVNSPWFTPGVFQGNPKTG